jgi:LDH2 family malate/lactate/ureidoglycolate dehydrogenase
MYGDRTVTVEVDQLRRFMREILMAVGCDADVADELADVHLDADLRGVAVQGLNHLINSHQRELRSGKEVPSAKPEVVLDRPAVAMIDGHSGPGPIAAATAARLAVAKAREVGCAAVGIRNSHDLYMAGRYATQIAEAGLVGMVFSDDVVPVVHPVGGAEGVIGSNPMAIAVPSAGTPVVIDFSPIETLPTYIRYAQRYGEQLPAGVAHGPSGEDTIDPALVGNGRDWQPDLGAIAPLGNKGYGLLLAIDLLSGALVGCSMGTDHVTDQNSTKGHLLVAIDPAAFGDSETFCNAVTHRCELVKSSRLASGSPGIRVPGERSAAALASALASGVVAVDEICWSDATALAQELGVTAPQLADS